jgi:hypothetical protein
VTLAAAFSLAHIALPSPPVHAEIVGAVQQAGFDIPDRLVVVTTALYTPLLWLLACAVIIVSYARRPAPLPSDDRESPRDAPADAAPSDPAGSERISEFSEQQPT